MTVFNRIKKLAKKRGKSMQAVAEENNFSSNLFYRWQTSDPKGKDLAKIADYFHTTTDYLLGRTDNSNLPSNTITDDDLEEMLDNAHSYDGKPLDKHDKEIIKNYLQGFFAGKESK